ncbi:nucleotide sugar dehydrogenase [Flavobacterium sp. AG291]|uniref:nucleotide sugar dehydrogenase n=1 Tax=Flavobacterium sp. AG291 TaxID=2184000 RepID=UPI000E0BB9EF|nr:nucleotide sugar dehydrogenase [Flavobacterium sp. AG291]RDI11222.1 UDP-N-acetyl-D-galactosamine dehydrogenase [Flavobacterium sp. AG291]
MKIAIIGLGYVGLPLAKAFSKKFSVVGFDISKYRIMQLNAFTDSTNELTSKELMSIIKRDNDDMKGVYFSSNPESLKNCTFYIVTVPTPVDTNNVPDMLPIVSATKNIALSIKKGATVVYESTVYPGATEEICVPLLEEISGLRYNIDFFVGYSPERINPSDKKNTIENIIKVTSGSTPEAAINIDNLYKSVIKAGTHRVSSIKVAEAAKVIENTQRDLNIAFVNELAKIFNKIGIDTNEVLEAAATKWNFQKFSPGLVGGHCIGVDPYYLAYQSQKLGHMPEIILAGRRVNESMGEYIATRVVKLMIGKKIQVLDSRILILGATFKENCPDVRNSKVVDVFRALESFGTKPYFFDPLANATDFWTQYSLKLEEDLTGKKYDAIILAVAHEVFLTINIKELLSQRHVIYDVKGFLKICVDEIL